MCCIFFSLYIVSLALSYDTRYIFSRKKHPFVSVNDNKVYVSNLKARSKRNYNAKVITGQSSFDTKKAITHYLIQPRNVHGQHRNAELQSDVAISK